MKHEKLKRLCQGVVSGVLCALAWSTTTYGATIRADFRVNLRSEGSRLGDIILTVEPGQIAQLLDSDEDWFLVGYQGMTGYSHSSFWSGHTLRAADWAKLRETAHPQSPVLARIAKGTEVIVFGRSGDWLFLSLHGIQGFSHRSNWEVSSELFQRLPHVISEPLDLTRPNQLIPRASAAVSSAGDRYEVLTEIPVFETAKAAQMALEPSGKEPPGAFIILNVWNGMLKLRSATGSSTFWMNPKDNDGVSSGLPNGQAPDSTQTQIETARIGAVWNVRSSLPGHIEAREAASGDNPAVTVTPGTYYIFNIYRGMFNVSTDPTVPGAWINPAKEAALTDAPPEMSEQADHPTGMQVVAEAKKLIGAPYIFGAESWEEGGFDCSGLTQFVYSQVGIDIPRLASAQWAGITSKVTQPLPGDIVAFEKEGKVYHVGIYIGDGQMIHAPKPGALVKLSSLDWWYRNSVVKGFLRPYSK